jgi:tRNA uridine 5-carbamoylmethylation protein Kti12
LSGFHASGKSTIARQIVKRTDAIIIDQAVVKSALLHSIETTPIHTKLAGEISCNIDWSFLLILVYEEIQHIYVRRFVLLTIKGLGRWIYEWG